MAQQLRAVARYACVHGVNTAPPAAIAGGASLTPPSFAATSSGANEAKKTVFFVDKQSGSLILAQYSSDGAISDCVDLTAALALSTGTFAPAAEGFPADRYVALWTGGSYSAYDCVRLVRGGRAFL